VNNSNPFIKKKFQFSKNKIFIFKIYFLWENKNEKKDIMYKELYFLVFFFDFLVFLIFSFFLIF